MASEFPEDVKRFILEKFESVEQLEALLLLRAHPDRDWDPAMVSKELYTQPEAAAQRLSALQSSGLIACTDPGGPRFRYRPSTPALEQLVNRLAETYRERRVAVISLIYSKPLNQVQAFSDAFKLRKEK